MIKQIQIENFRCIKEVQIDLEPLTILIGPNASGKSSILRALQPGWQLSQSDVWEQQPQLPVKIIKNFSEGTNYTHIRGETGSAGTNGSNYNAQFLRLDPGELRSQNQLARVEQLNGTGSNLANLFATLSRQQQIALSKKLCQTVPVFRDLDTTPTKAGHHLLFFQDRWNEKAWYRPEQVSDGTMLVLAFLILQYQPQPVDILLIEEPERGLHPYLLERVVTILRALAHGEFGEKPIQVVIATHSSELLNFARPEEVRFVRRDIREGATKVEKAPVDSPDWENAFNEYDHSLGEIWLSGSLGGV
jgi:predicted ATPase